MDQNIAIRSPIVESKKRDCEEQKDCTGTLSSRSVTKETDFNEYDLVYLIDGVIKAVIKRNSEKERANPYDMRLIYNRERFKAFYGLKVPKISLFHYMKRLIEKGFPPSVTSEDKKIVMVNALIYIDGFAAQGLSIDENCVFRAFLVSFVVASKFLLDDYYDNRTLAEVGGTTLKELNNIEFEFAFSLEFGFFVEQSLFCQYWQALENRCKSNKTLDRSIGEERS